MAQLSFGNGIFDKAPPIVNANEHHMALLFLLDISESMGSTSLITNSAPINELGKAIDRFKVEVCKDERTKGILDVAIVEYNNNYRIVQEFTPVEYIRPVEFEASGTTYLAKPLDLALDMVNERSRFYNKIIGVEPYKPWVVIITDGLAMDDEDSISPVIKKANEMAEADKVAVWSLVAGDAANDPGSLSLLHRICGKRVLKLQGYDFNGFLDWANKSMRAVSVSSPGEKVKGQPLPASITIDDLM